MPVFLQQDDFVPCLYSPLFLPCCHFCSRVNFCFAFISAMNFFSGRVIFYLTFICDLPSFLRWGGFVICLYFCLAFFQQQFFFKSKIISKLKKGVKWMSRQPIIMAQREVATARQKILQEMQKYRLFHEFWDVWDVLGYFWSWIKKGKGSGRQPIITAWQYVGQQHGNKRQRQGNGNCKKYRNTDYFTISKFFWMFLDIFQSWIKRGEGSGRQPIIMAWQQILQKVQK